MSKLLELLKQYRVTSQFGQRKDPFGSGRMVNHTGIDLVGKTAHDPIEAFVDGIVTHAKEGMPGSGYGGFGWVVAVKDAKGYTHMYAHLQANTLKVKVGDKVKIGQVLGNQGTTGRSTGCHLHYEVRKHGFGTHVNPMEYLETLMKEQWHRNEDRDGAHETAVHIRKMIGKKEA